jgi:uncharacterized membrane protein (DUF485 family)
MLHEPAASHGKDYGSVYKTRLGVWMFLLYALVYAGFMAINVISPETMAMATPVFGLNLAAVYGFGLIVFALVLALIYNRKCSQKENALRAADTETRPRHDRGDETGESAGFDEDGGER